MCSPYTAYQFSRVIASDPLILFRVSIHQEYHYARHLIKQRLRSSGRMATVRGALRQTLESCRVRNKGVFF